MEENKNTITPAKYEKLITDPSLNSEKNLKIKPYTLDDLQQDLTKTKDGLKTGYKSLDAFVRIPNEAITLVAGRPSHGKTTFMLNLFKNLIEEYSNLHFYFFHMKKLDLK